MRVQATPDDLDRFAAAAADLAASLERTGHELGPALDASRDTGGRAEHLAAVPALDAGELVTLATLPPDRAGEDGRAIYDDHDLLAGQHAYVILDVTADGALVLHNPWEADHTEELVLTATELAEVGWHLEVNRW